MLKRLAILAVVFAVTQALVPVSGQTPDNGANNGKRASQSTESGEDPAPAIAPVPTQNDRSGGLKPETGDGPGDTQQGAVNITDTTPMSVPWGLPKWAVWIGWVASLILTGFLIWGVLVARGTLKAIETQAGLMEKQWKEMQKASEIGTKTLILQYRPRITVRDVRVKAFSKEISEGVIGISKPVRCAMSLQIVNTGGSPAHIVEGDIYLISARRGHDAEEAEAEVKESAHMGIGERTLQPGQWEVIEFGLDTGIPNDARWVELHKGVSSHSIV
jgi:hypothetical protein